MLPHIFVTIQCQAMWVLTWHGSALLCCYPKSRNLFCSNSIARIRSYWVYLSGLYRISTKSTICHCLTNLLYEIVFMSQFYAKEFGAIYHWFGAPDIIGCSMPELTFWTDLFPVAPVLYHLLNQGLQAASEAKNAMSWIFLPAPPYKALVMIYFFSSNILWLCIRPPHSAVSP